MPPKSSAVRSSRASRRHFPYSHSPTPASLHNSSSPLPAQHPLSGHYTASYASETDLSGPSAHHHQQTSSTLLHPSRNSVTGYPSVPAFLSPRPINAVPPSVSMPQVTHSTHRAYPFPQPPVQMPFLRNSYHPPSTTNILYPNPIHLPHNSQPLSVEQPSMSIYQPEGSTYRNYFAHQPPLEIPQGQVPTFPRQMHPPVARYQSRGMFSGSHNLAFSDNTFIDNSITSDNFMKDLLQHTIIGAEFDSSDRHPPPRCHPGTRLAIIERCQMFIAQCDGKEKIRWVVGAAGVGKSAVMQIVAEEIPADASVFFSVNGRQDGTKVVTTIAYQLAAKYEPYRQFIRAEISRDPSLLRKSLPVQFQKFIVDPFIHRHVLNPSHRLLIIIDGLDECDDAPMQQEFLGLITDFCIKYPTSSIVWIIASRPEPHITSFFDDARVATAYTKEEIMVDLDKACEDVQRYLHDELNKIKLAYPTLKCKREWPSKLEFTKIATAASGLFAYASTVVRYIGHPHYRDPVTQLCLILDAIDGGPKGYVSGKDHPMALLDALYQRILSNIPADAMMNTRKLLLIYSDYRRCCVNFRMTCNILGLSEAAAYSAICQLHAILKVPAPDNAGTDGLVFFHKSFPDFLHDFERSKFSPNIQDESDRLWAQCSFRIVEQVLEDWDSMDGGEGIECGQVGHLKGGPGFCDTISLSWPGDERYQITDDQLRLKLYCGSMADMCNGLGFDSKFYWSMSRFHILTTRFTALGVLSPISELRDSAFDQFRLELTELGKLKQVPLSMFDYAAVCGWIEIRFTSPIEMDAQHFDPWNTSCEHFKRADEHGDGFQGWRGWKTSFGRFIAGHGADATHADIPKFNIKAGKDSHWEIAGFDEELECLHCSRRFAHHFIDNSHELASVFIDSTELCYAELSFVDPDDGVSEWRYRFFHSGNPSCID